MTISLPCYDRDGNPITVEEFILHFGDPGYSHVRITAIGKTIEVSTVWLGLDYNFGREGPPLIFETMVFGGPLDQAMERYPTVEAAEAGHDRWVAAVRDHVARMHK